MSSVNCNVMNCGNNDSGTCYANKISVNGKKSRTSKHTNCVSFLESSNSGALTSSTNSDSPCSFVGCNVKTCAHNAGTICSLNSITVTSEVARTNANSETYCSSFKCK